LFVVRLAGICKKAGSYQGIALAMPAAANSSIAFRRCDHPRASHQIITPGEFDRHSVNSFSV
jgi:hypothetical protein